MPIDASIPLQVQPVKIESGANQLAMMESAAKMQELNRANEDRNALRGLDPNSPDYVTKVSQINPALGMQMGAHKSLMAKQGVETEAAQYKLGKDKTNTAILAIANLDSPQAALEDLNRRVQAGEIPLATAQQHAQQIQNTPWKQYKTNTIDSLLSAHEKATIDESRITNRTNSGIAQQNANTAAFNSTKPQFSIEAGGWVYPPSAPRANAPTGGATINPNAPTGGATINPNAPTGAAPTTALTSKFVPVEGITPKPTEDQAKTNSNINRIVIAAKSMSKVLKNNPKALAPTGVETLAQATPLWEGASAPLTNLTRSADRQVVSSGYADIIDALLYLSTGAAYNKEQLAAQREAFLPAWSDKEANKIEKVAKLEDLVRMARTRTGKAWTPELEKATQQLLPANLTNEAVPDTTKSGATKSNW